MKDMICSKCKMTLKKMMLLAMLQDAGARVYPTALECSEGREHELIDIPPAADAVDAEEREQV